MTTLRRFMHEESMRDSDAWLAKLMVEDELLAVRIMEVRKAYANEDFEWDNLRRVALEGLERGNTQLLRQHASRRYTAMLERAGETVAEDLPSLDAEEVKYNIQQADPYESGGQAQVYITRWRACPGVNTGIIQPGDHVAIKRIRSNWGGGRFSISQSQWEVEVANAQSIQGQRIELNLLSLLHASGCGTRIPANGYVMKAYPLGSLSNLLQDICYRRVPESVGQRFLNLRTMSAEYATMLGELHNIHTKPAMGMMIQDLTPGNLLVDDTPDGMRLLLADPAMAQPIKLLQDERSFASDLCGTWLWGSMLMRHRRFDPSADLYSLSIIFAEVWLVAEGAVNAPADMIALLAADQDRARGVQFMRRLVWEVLRLHHQNTIKIKPRVQRHLPVSWLGAWLLLLGFRDYACEQHMRQGLPCLRPSEEAVLEAAQLWARIAAAAEELPPSLTEEQAVSPACKCLVDDMAQLLQKLVGLSHLSDAGEQEDPALAWCAANFMEQTHPLVAALKARTALRGALLAATPSDFAQMQREFRDQLLEGEEVARKMRELGQWYKELLRKKREGAIPIDLYNELCPPANCHLVLSPKFKKSKIDGNTKYARDMVPAYANSMQQLLGAPGTPSAPLTTYERKVAFLQWWIGVGPKPSITGRQLGPQSISRYVLAVMDHANPQHGLALGQAGWPKHVAAMPHAANAVLQALMV
ncbi:hypothetical protein C2E21_3267 [Chlorella sorokiniana]|uniref:Protein kinase domain-containing protein n=1 Tax=Chlorella sorokiniana TaxID=3076 RepID=A0A2P6TXD3_CHLSO|nr:hypothetical protein C2E21_3267 [Chlorella sorokiniana]|eukprot:PRW58723.1 hypothetical protein C2E21_3267 [Chlorella sorokiniana]